MVFVRAAKAPLSVALALKESAWPAAVERPIFAPLPVSPEGVGHLQVIPCPLHIS